MLLTLSLMPPPPPATYIDYCTVLYIPPSRPVPNLPLRNHSRLLRFPFSLSSPKPTQPRSNPSSKGLVYLVLLRCVARAFSTYPVFFLPLLCSTPLHCYYSIFPSHPALRRVQSPVTTSFSAASIQLYTLFCAGCDCKCVVFVIK